MTQLNNIFIGNKVVKQAFLNDALIYQSNGWEPTPSTMQQVFNKQYSEIPNSTSSISVKVDSRGNIISARLKTIYKTNSDGKLLWQKTIFTSNSNFQITSMVVDRNDNIFCSGDDATFMQINTSSGEIVKKVDLNSKYRVNSVSAMSVDNNQIYAMTKPPINFLKMDFSGNVTSVIPWTSGYKDYVPIAIDAGASKHIYAVVRSLTSNNIYAFRIDKANPNSYVTFVYNEIGYRSDVITDSLANAYVTYAGTVYKFSPNSTGNYIWKVESPFSNHGGSFQELTVDQQDNIYAFDGYNIYKYSSDGTFLWKGPEMWQNNNSTLTIACDKNNLVVASGYNNNLSKFISLIQTS